MKLEYCNRCTDKDITRTPPLCRYWNMGIVYVMKCHKYYVEMSGVIPKADFKADRD